MDPEAIVRTLFAAFAARDVEGALPLLDPDFELEPQPTAQRAGRRGAYRGHDGWRRYMADVDAVWETFQVHPDDVRAAGGGVICFGRAEGRTRAGEEVRVPLIWVVRVAGGRVQSCRVVPTAAEAERLAAAEADRA